MQRHHHRPEPRQQRRPRGQPEVRVDDVEPLPAVAPAQRHRRAHELPRTRAEGEQLHVEVVRRRNASTWSRTNGPSAGRSGVGYMFVTTRTRTAATLPPRTARLAQRPAGK